MVWVANLIGILTKVRGICKLLFQQFFCSKITLGVLCIPLGQNSGSLIVLFHESRSMMSGTVNLVWRKLTNISGERWTPFSKMDHILNGTF
jgi:hypothetical protein